MAMDSKKKKDGSRDKTVEEWVIGLIVVALIFTIGWSPMCGPLRKDLMKGFREAVKESKEDSERSK